MSLVIINEKVFFERDEFASCQEEIVRQDVSCSPSDSCIRTIFDGVVITLKNGRKIYVDGIGPKYVLSKLSESPAACETKESKEK